MEFETISKGLVSRLAMLRHKKIRNEKGVFVAEGAKCVADTISHFRAECVVATDSWLTANHLPRTEKILRASTADMGRISSLSTPPEIVAVYRRPQWVLDTALLQSDITLILDDVQDPGNLGTIVRLADWFGVRQIVASRGTADIFSPKTIQATMGCISRVSVFYTDLIEFIDEHPSIPTVGLLLDGENIYRSELPNPAFIIMGNEGKGISPTLRAKLTHRFLIPSYPAGAPTGESLNVAMATAITLSEFRRRQ